MNKHVVFLSYDGLSDPLGEAQVLPYVKGLSALGWSYTLISFEKPVLFARNKERLQAECQRHGIDWQPISYTKSPPVLSTLYDQWRLGRQLKKLFRKRPFQLLHCRGYITAPQGLYWQKKGIPFLFDMRGFFPDERADAGLWKKDHPLFGVVYRYFKRLELKLLSRADHVISLTEKGKTIMQEMLPQHGLSLKPCTVIPCCTDLELFNPDSWTAVQRQQWREVRHVPPSAPLLMYVGSLGTWYMLNEMLDFFSEFLLLQPESRFLLATRDNSDAVWSAARQRNIPAERILVEGFSRAELPLAMSSADAAVFFIRPSYSKQASSPTKQGELMAMNIPVFCNTGVGDTDALVGRYRSGILIPEFNSAAYQTAIQRWQREQNQGFKHCRGGAVEAFSLSRGVQLYHEVYVELLKSH
jgi:glycosyltransferase involved in cell wall biosynthesis